MRISDPHAALGGFLRSLRDGRQIRQADLADILGVSQSAISETEGGGRPLPTTRLARWLDVLGATDAERLEALRLASISSDPQPTVP